jgi:ATP-dependent helicase/nuclease subunit B
MLRIVTGPFHPDLERALADTLQGLKAADPFAPIAIVVPSDPLRRRLQWLLGGEREKTLLNVHFLTFHQLSIRLLDEAQGYKPESVRPPLFFRELVHQVLRAQTLHAGQGGAGASCWAGLAEMPGAWAALWATLKDLKDADVGPDVVLEALGSREQESNRSLEDLIRLHAEVRDAVARLGVGDHDDLGRLACACVASSRFLGSLARVVYYGFYDLTQVQLDLFQTIARAYPTTVFFPLVRSHPAFEFAERFFERHLQGLLRDAADWIQVSLPPRPSGGGPSTRRLFAATEHEGGAAPAPGSLREAGPVLQIVQVSGREDETTFVAKDILRLVETRGYAFDEIGVVGRTLAGYDAVIPRVFREQGIPFTTTLTWPLASFPAVKTALQLLDLRQQGYRRDLAIEVLASPFLRLEALDPECSAPRPDLWDLASRRAGIAKGLEEWQRLEAYEHEGVPLEAREIGDEEAGPEPRRVPGGQVRALLRCLRALDVALGDLPLQAGWSELVLRARALWDRVLVQDPEVAEAVTACLEEVAGLGCLPGEVSLADFVATLRRHTEESGVRVGPQSEAGVQVRDAMTARGLGFRALYLLNLNERVFPRHVREDAFLRDPARRFLEVDLGYKIQEKLAGFEEEKLLFYLLTNAVREQLTLLVLRSDDRGRALVPSLYLDEVRRLEPGLADGELIVPRRWSDRFAHPRLPLYQPEWLTPAELLQRELLQRRRPAPALFERHAAGALAVPALAAVRAHDRSSPHLGDYDGITGHLPAFWRGLVAGLSPTSLQRYAVCPFQYFASHVLALEPLEAPESVGGLSPLEIGTLAHAVLRETHRALRARGFFADGGTAVEPAVVLQEVAQPILEDYARTHPVGYPLLWDLARQDLLALLLQALQEDLEEMRQPQDGFWQPVLFEAPMRGHLRVKLRDGAETFALEGQVDRVDWVPGRRACRVVDYKYKTGTKPKSLETNLERAAVKGRRLQPPFYVLMAADTLGHRQPAELGPGPVRVEGVWFFYLAPRWRKTDPGPIVTRVSFPGDAWDSALRDPLQQSLAAMLEGIRSGWFFIYPGGHCDTCDYRTLCRKNHQPSWWRARADHARAEPFRRLQRAEPGAGGETPAAPKPARRARRAKS